MYRNSRNILILLTSGVHSGYSRQTRRVSDSLYVMANHGQLLEYSLDPGPDPSKPS